VRALLEHQVNLGLVRRRAAARAAARAARRQAVVGAVGVERALEAELLVGALDHL
jgi:hypothetical protein